MRYCILLITFLSLARFSQAQWTTVNSGVINNLRCIYFSDSLTGYCVGGGSSNQFFVHPNDEGIILKTVDGGLTWQTVYQDSLTGFSKVVAYENKVHVFGWHQTDAVLLTSIDGGNSWTIDSTFHDYIEELKIYEGDIYYRDNMSSLKKRANDSSIILKPAIGFFDVNSSGIIAWTGNTIMERSYDFGQTWDSINFNSMGFISPSGGNYAVLNMFGDSITMMVTYGSAVIYSNDNGLSWSGNNGGPGYALTIVNPYTIYGVQHCNVNSDNNYCILKTGDYGVSWESQYNSSNDIFNFYLYNGNLGFACGANGTILRTINGGGAPEGIKESSNLKKKLKISPNPAKNTINLQYNNLQIQSLRLTDLSGRVVKAFPAESKTLNVSGIAAGLYFLQVKAKEGTVAKKVEIR